MASANPALKVGFSDLLANEAGVELFRRFLVSAFAVESLSFLQETQEFEQQVARAHTEAEREACIATALDIHARFIAPGAEFQVNLPAEIVAELNRALAPYRRATSATSAANSAASAANADAISASAGGNARMASNRSSDVVTAPRLMLPSPSHASTAVHPLSIAVSPTHAAAAAASPFDEAVSPHPRSSRSTAAAASRVVLIAEKGHANANANAAAHHNKNAHSLTQAGSSSAQAPLADLFIAARADIARLLERDTFPRFVRTAAYRAFVELEPVKMVAEV